MNSDACKHSKTTKEVVGGMKTGDRICDDCGEILSPAEFEEIRKNLPIDPVNKYSNFM